MHGTVLRRWVQKCTSDSQQAFVLNRTFDAASANRKWVADFTHIWMAEDSLYVAAVMNLFSRRVVGWSMSATMTAQLVTDTLVMAIWRRGTPNHVLHHSDQGSRSSAFWPTMASPAA